MRTFESEDLYDVAKNTSLGINTNTIALDKNSDIILYDKQQLRQYLQPLVDHSVTTIAPPIVMILEVDNNSGIVISQFLR